MAKQGEAVIWEQMPLHASPATFLKTAGELTGVPGGADPQEACTSQTSLAVPDLEKKRIVERPGTDRALSNCRVQSTRGTQSSMLVEVHGEFIDSRLSRVRFRFRGSERARILRMLGERFGPGDEIELIEDSLETGKIKVRYWRDGDDLWLLESAVSDTVVLTHQDLKGGTALPLPAAAARRGEPVSLDDIGIGKLDLKALPTLDLPSGVDAGAATE